MHQLNLQDKKALVCGASKGIGRAIAYALAENGCTVILLARNQSLLNEVLVGLPRNHQQEHQALPLDLSDLAAVESTLKNLVLINDFHILINNTGGPPGGRLELAEIPALESAIRQHLMAAHLVTKAVLPGMKRHQYGRIINVLSTSVKQPLDHLGVSNTVRAAMANWAKTLANELAVEGITVNNILPGATNTDRLQDLIIRESDLQKSDPQQIAEKMLSHIPMKRFARPEEIAWAVLFLASPLASYITGINLPIDGGRTKSL
ncbi:MAG: SDR family oxidoreductase [Saprospiraceae bacterium]|nr:SDR family oxidoreductase [Saprospiraceae bacterium]